MLSMPTLLSRVAELPAKRLYLVAGPAASGKTTFSLALARYLGAALLSMDHYYVDEEQVVREYDEKYGLVPQWESPEAYNVERMQQDICELLRTGHAKIPHYSFVENRKVGEQEMSLGLEQPLIVEGLYAIRFEPLFRELTDSFVSLYIQAETEVRRARSRVRDVVERGKLPEEFEKRYHFVSLGEQRWGLSQMREANFVVEANEETRECFFL
ncbi:uridine kinase family protein [Ktedonobacter robiniae]|uniref:Phosphoribulokinase/uridine kinase domain-containing protein n=1 Tax=Ktedonobacter robiniae TaxID=2778365 RepID=A0ABQ3V469_9CHLR|nr:AAA family ATPase [Ktedonobacter robiniae]GHO59685.1 hypothetical protein KSB_81600 [Ktedonobacter robiniae]